MRGYAAELCWSPDVVLAAIRWGKAECTALRVWRSLMPCTSARAPQARLNRPNSSARVIAPTLGFGSFYNHFDSKDELFATAFAEVLER